MMDLIKNALMSGIITLTLFLSVCFTANADAPNGLLRYLPQPVSQKQSPKKFQKNSLDSLQPVILPIAIMKKMGAGDTILFNLPFPVGNQNIIFDEFVTHDNGDVSWNGHAEGYDGVPNPTIITIGKNAIEGIISTPYGNFSVQTAGEGGVWLIDRAKTDMPALSHDHLSLDGTLLTESALPKAAPALQLFVPAVFRVGQSQTIRWQADGFVPKAKAKFRFLNNGQLFKNKSVRVKKGSFNWKPTKRQVTDAGTLEMCASPTKGSAPVCTTANFIVVCKTCPDPSPPSPPPDTEKPNIGITSPANGAVVSGMVTIAASTSDNVGVAGVQFKLDDVNLGAEDTSSPFGISWNSVGTANGSHTLTAIARDAAGNVKTSAGITVTVNNTSPPSNQPPTPITGLKATATFNSVNLSWNESTDDSTFPVKYAVVRNNTVVASIFAPSFNDTPLSSGTSYTYLVTPIDNTGKAGTSASITVKTLSSTGATTIDVMIYHTPDISPTRLNFLVALTNQARKDSGVNGLMRIVAMKAVSYPPEILNVNAISDLSSGAGVFANIFALRAQFGADLVTFVRSLSANQTNCGIGYLNGENGSPLLAMYGFSVVGDGSACLDTVFAHETGHSGFGLAHDWADGTSSGAVPYAHGYCVPGVAGDIMGSGSCGFSTFPLFSNPNITVNGIPFGKPKDGPLPADNASALNLLTPQVINFMPSTQ